MDSEANTAIHAMPCNQLGMHSLFDVLKWWKTRVKKLEAADIPVWRFRLHRINDLLQKPWEFLDFLTVETKRQVQINKVEGDWSNWKEEEGGGSSNNNNFYSNTSRSKLARVQNEADGRDQRDTPNYVNSWPGRC